MKTSHGEDDLLDLVTFLFTFLADCDTLIVMYNERVQLL